MQTDGTDQSPQKLNQATATNQSLTNELIHSPEKGQSFQQMVLEKLDLCMKKYGIGPFLSSYTETSSECSKDLNLRPETIKLLDKNTGETLQVIEIGKDFLYKIPKAEAKKSDKNG